MAGALTIAVLCVWRAAVVHDELAAALDGEGGRHGADVRRSHDPRRCRVRALRPDSPSSAKIVTDRVFSCGPVVHIYRPQVTLNLDNTMSVTSVTVKSNAQCSVELTGLPLSGVRASPITMRAMAVPHGGNGVWYARVRRRATRWPTGRTPPTRLPLRPPRLPSRSPPRIRSPKALGVLETAALMVSLVSLVSFRLGWVGLGLLRVHSLYKTFLLFWLAFVLG